MWLDDIMFNQKVIREWIGSGRRLVWGKYIVKLSNSWTYWQHGITTCKYMCRKGVMKVMCLTPCTLEVRCRKITSSSSNIVNPSIPSKHRWHVKLGWTMINYSFYITTSQSGGEGKGNTQIDTRTDIHTNLTGHTGISMIIETINPIVLGFSQIRVQLEFWW